MSISADVLSIVRALRTEALDDFGTSLDTVSTLLQNILEQPEAAKYRTVRLANAAFHRRLGRFTAGLQLLRTLGFEDACQDGSAEPSHLALAEADPSSIAQGLVLVNAAREAHAQVLQEQQPTARAPAAAASSSSSSSSSSRATGKRPAGADPDSKRAKTTSGIATTGAADELTSYAADDIDAYFLGLCGGAFLEGLNSVDATTFARLCATARDAKRVTAGTGDADAEARAAHWSTALEEHGRLLGWAVEDHGEENDEDEDAAAGTAERQQGGGSAAGGSGASSGGSSSAHPDPIESEPVIIAQDGNFDVCAMCGGGGLLYCCEACPQAYHRECLGAQAPPDDDDDDAAWFCPPCAEALGMGGAGQ